MMVYGRNVFGNSAMSNAVVVTTPGKLTISVIPTDSLTCNILRLVPGKLGV